MLSKHRMFVTEETNFKTPSPTLAKAFHMADAGDLKGALKILVASGEASLLASNARGVCLMRMGRAEDAVQVYRICAVDNATMYLRRDLPVIVGTNFATALLLSGRTAGAANTLSEIGNETHPSVARLRSALAKWEAELSWWQKVCWKAGLVPSHPVTLEFMPGDFMDLGGLHRQEPPSRPPAEGEAA